MKTVNKKVSSRVVRNRSVFMALFAALISVSAVFAVPLPGGVPVVLKDMLAILAGTVLGSFQGAGAVGLYLAAGMVGLPVFAGAAGVAAFASPTGGYLVGFFLGALAAGLMLGKPSVTEKPLSFRLLLRTVKAALAGWLVVYVCGVAQLMNASKLGLGKALAAGVLPFLPVAAVKLGLLILLTVRLRPVAARYLNDEDDEEDSTELSDEEAAELLSQKAKTQGGGKTPG